MAKSKKIDKDMGFRLKKARLDQKLTYQKSSGDRSSFTFIDFWPFQSIQYLT